VTRAESTSERPTSTVLVVEDEPDMRQLMVGLLRGDGYDAIGAAGGREALRSLRDGGVRPCLILLDLVMPDMNGWEFRAELQDDAHLASIPFIVVSGYVQALAKQPPGAVAQLEKPIDLDELLALVARYCANGAPAA
jgi:CheY-like chemotaxis protein